MAQTCMANMGCFHMCSGGDKVYFSSFMDVYIFLVDNKTNILMITDCLSS